MVQVGIGIGFGFVRVRSGWFGLDCVGLCWVWLGVQLQLVEKEWRGTGESETRHGRAGRQAGGRAEERRREAQGETLGRRRPLAAGEGNRTRQQRIR